MNDGPLIASIAALIGDPGRANMLTALIDGRALTASELAGAAGTTLQTASGHLSRLVEAGLLAVRKQGRHRYFSLSGPDVAETLEALMGLAQRTGAVRVRTGPRDAALREARICYDHLAGARGVALLEALRRRQLVTGEEEIALTEAGRIFFAGLGVDLDALEQARRPLCRLCLDWSERRGHLGGALGAALLELMAEQSWLRREEGRVLRFSPAGARAFERAFAG
ncbi:MAG: winged helix-turn-helix transcriptional regulator [Sphingomonadaceae bacterium]|nr:winged helix-turn-helix transcriptional regulator [Sphingomonadaceae bacterium]